MFVVFGLLGLVVVAGGGIAFVLANNRPNATGANGSNDSRHSGTGPSIIEKIAGTLSKPGRVRVTVTWEYNKFVGNKPDTDATATLIPKGYSRKVDAASLHPMVARISFDAARQKLREEGVYAGIVGGDGKTLIADVPVGSYTMIIISKNTNEHPDIAKLTEKLLTRYFKDTGSAGLRKVHITDITVPSGEETEYSHDFGNTYF